MRAHKMPWLGRTSETCRGGPRRYLPHLLYQRARGAGAKSGTADCKLSEDLAVSADYGLTVISDSSPAAQQFADFIMSPEGQAILTKHGFTSGK